MTTAAMLLVGFFSVNSGAAPEALCSFQRECGLAETGRLDAATRSTFDRLGDAIASIRAREIPEVDGDEAAVQALEAVVRDEDELLERRLLAVALIRNLGTTRARATLEQIMYAELPVYVRIAAVDALAALGDPDSLFAISLASDQEFDPMVANAMSQALDHGLALEMPPEEPVEMIALVPDDSAAGTDDPFNE